MNNKQKAIIFLMKVFKFVLGNIYALKLMKRILRILPPRYAFPITYLCLSEFPLETQNFSEWLYGYHRLFPNIPLKINPKCLHSRFFVASGYYEHFLTNELLNHSRKGVFIDIGANYGYYSFLWLANNSENTVIAVEPIEKYVQLLQENLHIYPSKYHIYQGCVGNYDGDALMDTIGEPTMLSKVVTENNNSLDFVSVKMITLDSLIANYGLLKVDVLKVDAEGYDIQILKSAENLFREHRIKAVFWEGTKEDSQSVINFLEEYGYQCILERDAIGYELKP